MMETACSTSTGDGVAATMVTLRLPCSILITTPARAAAAAASDTVSVRVPSSIPIRTWSHNLCCATILAAASTSTPPSIYTITTLRSFTIHSMSLTTRWPTTPLAPSTPKAISNPCSWLTRTTASFTHARFMTTTSSQWKSIQRCSPPGRLSTSTPCCASATRARNGRLSPQWSRT